MATDMKRFSCLLIFLITLAAFHLCKQINQCEAEGKPWATDCTLAISLEGLSAVFGVYP